MNAFMVIAYCNSYQGKPDRLHMKASQLILDAAEIIMAEAEV